MNKYFLKKLNILLIVIFIIINQSLIFASNENNQFVEEIFSEDYISEDTLKEFAVQNVVSLIADEELTIDKRLILLKGINNKKTYNFLYDLQKNINEIGELISVVSNDLIVSNGQYESRMVLKFEKGDITINLSFNKSLPYFVYINSKNIDVDVPNFEQFLFNDSNVFDDYYITKGINNNQLVGIKKFKKGLFIFLIIVILLIILKNILNSLYSKKENNNVFTEENNDLVNDTKLTAIITAAVCSYMNTTPNRIRIKTIKKTNWKKVD